MIVQESYFTFHSIMTLDNDPFSGYPISNPPDPPTSIKDLIAEGRLPNWFINADLRYKKVIRVIGLTVSKYLELLPDPDSLQPISTAWRLYSNINPCGNMFTKSVLYFAYVLAGQFNIR